MEAERKYIIKRNENKNLNCKGCLHLQTFDVARLILSPETMSLARKGGNYIHLLLYR